MIMRRSGIYLITQSFERTRKLQNAVLFLMLQHMTSMKYLSMTVFCQGQHFNLTWYQYYFDSEHVGLHLWLMLKRCSSRSRLTNETRTLYVIFGGIYKVLNNQECTSCKGWHLVLIVVHSWPLPQFKVMRRNAVKSSLMHQGKSCRTCMWMTALVVLMMLKIQ